MGKRGLEPRRLSAHDPKSCLVHVPLLCLQHRGSLIKRSCALRVSRHIYSSSSVLASFNIRSSLIWKKRWLSNSIGLILPSRTQRHRVMRLTPRNSAARVAVRRSAVLIVTSRSIVTVTLCNIACRVCQAPLRIWR